MNKIVVYSSHRVWPSTPSYSGCLLKGLLYTLQFQSLLFSVAPTSVCCHLFCLRIPYVLSDIYITVSQRHTSCYKADGWRAIIRLRINKTARGMMMDRESLYLIEENNSNRNIIYLSIHPSIHQDALESILSFWYLINPCRYIHRWRERDIFSSFFLSFKLLGELYSSIDVL